MQYYTILIDIDTIKVPIIKEQCFAFEPILFQNTTVFIGEGARFSPQTTNTLLSHY